MEQDSDRWKRIDRLFQEALDLDPEDRADYLDAHCPEPEDRAEVERLLAAAASSSDFLEGRTALEDALGDAVANSLGAEEAGTEMPDRIGQTIGAWKVVDRIGRGGMATVYRAERVEGGFEQSVALKVIRRGLDTEDVVRRFEGERDILSGLQHPNIAKLLDGGATPDGLPYLVMELVDGVDITRHADRERLSIRQRLDLFLAVVETVGHAHRNLVVHRDLKPSNILVAEDGRPVLLDFGIAKLLRDDADGEGLTRTGTRWITPEYAAPEQILGSPVTTATDVYQLGVLLFELLSGNRPFQTPGSSRVALEKAICTQDPPRPSSVVTSRTEGKSPEDTASARDSTTDRLRRTLHGDLDAIVSKALRKEPDERYASAQALALDIRRYLRAEPVEATRGGATYRARKFLRRNPGGVTAAVLVLLLVVGYAATVTLQAQRIAAERDRAELESEKAAEVTAFLTTLLEQADPREAQGEQVTVLEALEDGVARIGSELENQPEVQAALYYTTGEVYRLIGDMPAADSLLRRSVDIRSGPEPRDPDLGEALISLARVRNVQGRREEGLELSRAAVEHYRTIDPEGEGYADALSDLAESLRWMSRFDEAAPVYVEAIEAFRNLPEPDMVSVGIVENNLGLMYHETGRLGLASTYYQRGSRAVVDTLGMRHPYSLTLVHNLAGLDRDLGRLARSDSLYEVVLEAARAVEPESPGTATYIANAGMTLHQRGAYAEAEALLQESIRMFEPLGRTNPYVTMRLSNLAELYHDMGDTDRALAVLDDAIERATERNEGTTPGWLLLTRSDFLSESGETADAVAELEELLERRRAEYDAPDAQIANVLDDLGYAHLDANDAAAAEPRFRDAVAMRRELAGTEAQLGESLMAHSLVLLELGRLDEAAAAIEESRALFESYLPPGTLYAAEADFAAAKLALARGDLAEARAEAARVRAYIDRNFLGDRPFSLEFETLVAEIDAAGGRG